MHHSNTKCVHVFSIKSAVPLLCALQLLCAAAAAHAADSFKRLNSAEIRGKIVDNVVTDQAHWSDRFAADGIFHEMSLGVTRTAVWKLNGNEVCITRKTRKPLHECFEIWASGNDIEYRRGGIALMSGTLRNH